MTAVKKPIAIYIGSSTDLPPALFYPEYDWVFITSDGTGYWRDHLPALLGSLGTVLALLVIVAFFSVAMAARLHVRAATEALARPTQTHAGCPGCHRTCRPHPATGLYPRRPRRRMTVGRCCTAIASGEKARTGTGREGATTRRPRGKVGSRDYEVPGGLRAREAVWSDNVARSRNPQRSHFQRLKSRHGQFLELALQATEAPP